MTRSEFDQLKREVMGELSSPAFRNKSMSFGHKRLKAVEEAFAKAEKLINQK